MSGIIVLGIIAIWIAVLVPMWLNRHEADSASRSMDTFSTAMRVLSHRTSHRAPGRADREIRGGERGLINVHRAAGFAHDLHGLAYG